MWVGSFAHLTHFISLETEEDKVLQALERAGNAAFNAGHPMLGCGMSILHGVSKSPNGLDLYPKI